MKKKTKKKTKKQSQQKYRIGFEAVAWWEVLAELIFLQECRCNTNNFDLQQLNTIPVTLLLHYYLIGETP